MIHFIFFGRVTTEKGIDLILDCFSRLTKEGISNRQLDIFGDGPLAEKCKQIAENNKQIYYHGWTDMETIKRKLLNIDYCLMPSLVLETFGKSALEALHVGVPTIGYKKGGQGQFIDETLAITEQRSLYDICKYILINTTLQNKEGIKTGSLIYSKEKRIDSIKTIFGDKKNILHISDFISRIGGIETYLWESKELLEKHGYSVDLFGSEKKLSFLYLLATAWNIPAYIKLQKKLSKKKYNILRFHSLLRNLGWIVLCKLPPSTINVFMVHDLGYFHPYPSKLYNQNDIPNFSLHGFLSKGIGLKQKILITLKFISLSILKRKLTKTIHIRLVPSPFLVDILHISRGIPKEKIVVLPHFG